jgi:hypothetical protein
MERVMLGRRQIDKIIKEKIPVYEARMEGGSVFLDPNQTAFVKPISRIDSGETGHIAGEPVKVYKSTLVNANKAESMSGTETTKVFPIMLDTYRQVVWVPMEHVHLIDS